MLPDPWASGTGSCQTLRPPGSAWAWVLVLRLSERSRGERVSGTEQDSGTPWRSSPPGWQNQVIFQFQAFPFIHKMCQEPLSRKFKLKVNSTGTILSDKTTDSGASWDNIYSPSLLMASAASQVITVMHLLNLTRAAAPTGRSEALPPPPLDNYIHRCWRVITINQGAGGGFVFLY